MYVSVRSILRTAYRLYSTKPRDTPFLSDLLNRIDRISAKSKTLKETKSAGNIGQKQELKRNQNKQPRDAASRKVSSGEKIKVSDHPLFTNSFKQEKDVRRPRRQRNADGKGPRKDGAPSKAPNKNNRKPFPRRDTRASRNDNQGSGIARTQQFTNKTIRAEPLKPVLNASTFTYGKITTLNSCLSSRVASVTKETLISSNYPYQVPRTLIDRLDDVPKNRFLLQKNFTLDIDPETLSKRINEVVRGKWEDLKFDPADFKDASSLKRANFIKDELMRNGDLSLSDKTIMFNAASGLKTPKQLVQGASWNQK
ncbi:uncharacterized protein PRCAT00005321001 [Priceomyces carsonii]|uniref:uncharacterized protein n=1 Tax=Priceomyces carsonii TaxID=28549 RepID=UPI002EDB9094|nr:unnamed protein product [Priceomyces carsonii]